MKMRILNLALLLSLAQSFDTKCYEAGMAVLADEKKISQEFGTAFSFSDLFHQKKCSDAKSLQSYKEAIYSKASDFAMATVSGFSTSNIEYLDGIEKALPSTTDAACQALRDNILHPLRVIRSIILTSSINYPTSLKCTPNIKDDTDKPLIQNYRSLITIKSQDLFHAYDSFTQQYTLPGDYTNENLLGAIYRAVGFATSFFSYQPAQPFEISDDYDELVGLRPKLQDPEAFTSWMTLIMQYQFFISRATNTLVHVILAPHDITVAQVWKEATIRKHLEGFSYFAKRVLEGEGLSAVCLKDIRSFIQKSTTSMELTVKKYNLDVSDRIQLRINASDMIALADDARVSGNGRCMYEYMMSFITAFNIHVANNYSTTAVLLFSNDEKKEAYVAGDVRRDEL